MPPHPPRLTRRFPAQMTEAGYRGLKRAAEAHQLTQGEMLSFVFENYDGLIDEEVHMHRLARFKEKLGKSS